MGVKFTDEQRQAIETLDKSVLVAAAAGSGKTAVLVQRIIKIILEGRANVDEMLIVTFTKAAAAEMRIKLAKAIKKKMQEDESSRAKLKEQLNRLYRAYISTFDSFAVRVIREFFYEVDMEPNFKACDEIQAALMQKQTMDELFERAFMDDNYIEGGSFREFLRLYSEERSEEKIKGELIDAYKNLRTMPNYFDWAYERAALLGGDGFTGPVSEIIIRDCRAAIDEALSRMDIIAEMYADNGIEEKFELMLGDEYNVLLGIAGKLDKGVLDRDSIDQLSDIKWVDLRGFTKYFDKSEKDKKDAYNSFKKEITPIRNEYKGIIDTLKKDYFIPDFETRVREMNETERYTVYFLNILKKFEELYKAEKKDNGVLDFADMEHIAVSILERPEAAETLRRRFSYIFIDEYQDTNNIQEYLIGLIARPDNVFKVGDVKQSIYRFRQAEPAIFQRTYEKYSEENNADAVAIDLNKNFRSNDATLRYINEVFRKVMEGYDSKAQLYTGVPSGKGYQDEYDFMPEVHILSKDPEDWGGRDSDAGDEADLKDTANSTVDVDDAEEELENITKEESEAQYIASLVGQIIGTEFYDTRTGEVRKAEARDIAILARSVKYRGEVITRALREIQVQAHIEDDDNFFDTVEIGVAVSLFSCIDNLRRDVPLIATLHSEVFGFSPEELARIRIESRQNVDKSADLYNSRPAYWEALLWYCENGACDALKNKVVNAISKLKEWRSLSVMLPLEDFIWKVLVDSGYYLMAGAMYDGARRQANLRVLVDRARKYSEDAVASLSSFLSFIDVMKSKGIKNGQTGMVSKDEDVVKITTIHKSKGLEYPFVIVASLGVKFRKETNSMSFNYDSRTGIGLPYVRPDRHFWRSTLMQKAIVSSINAESYREELRVLYVAMTRARNKLYLVGSCDSVTKLTSKTGEPGSFLAVLRDSLDTGSNKLYVVPQLTTVSEPHRVRVADILASRPETMSAEVSRLYEEVERRLGYAYPEEAELKSKYSVSEIRRALLEQEQSLPDAEDFNAAEQNNPRPDDEVVGLWTINENKKKASAADIGIAYHRIMEFLDFAKVFGEPSDIDNGSPDEVYIKERAEFLRDHDAIEPEVFKKLRLENITAFFQSELGRRAARASAAGTLRKEKPFTLVTEYEGREVLVQGVIDCCWEENGEMVLVDYKSSWIRRGKEHSAELERIRKEYRAQIELYAKAISEGSDLPVKEGYLYLFLSGDAVSVIKYRGVK